MKSNYIVTNPSIKSFNTTVADADVSVEVIGAANEVFAVDQAERVWRARGIMFNPEISVARAVVPCVAR